MRRVKNCPNPDKMKSWSTWFGEYRVQKFWDNDFDQPIPRWRGIIPIDGGTQV